MVQIDTKSAPECFVKQFAETDYKKENISEVQAAFVAGTMIEVRHLPSFSLNISCL